MDVVELSRVSLDVTGRVDVRRSAYIILGQQMPRAEGLIVFEVERARSFIGIAERG